MMLPPPHPNPHRPTALRLPAGACDAHCHLFGPSDRFPFPANRRYTPPEASLESYEELQARMGLSRAVFVQSAAYGSDHGAMLDALRRGAGRYAGVALLDDEFSKADIAELHDAGVRGTRFHFVSHLGGSPSDETALRIVARIAPYGWHVLLHVDGPALLKHRALFERMPVPFVVDHMARIQAAGGLEQPAFEALLELLQDPRCWVKISGADRVTADAGPPYLDVVPFARALVDTAPDRVLWGTDWPHPNIRMMPDDGDLVDFLADMVPDEETRRKILVDNPQRLYRFGDPGEH